MITAALWHYRLWRARHRLWAAQMQYRRWPTPVNEYRIKRAARTLIALEIDRPS